MENGKSKECGDLKEDKNTLLRPTSWKLLLKENNIVKGFQKRLQ